MQNGTQPNKEDITPSTGRKTKMYASIGIELIVKVCGQLLSSIPKIRSEVIQDAMSWIRLVAHWAFSFLP